MASPHRLGLLEMLGVRLLVTGAVGVVVFAALSIGGAVMAIEVLAVTTWLAWSAVIDAYLVLSRDGDGR